MEFYRKKVNHLQTLVNKTKLSLVILCSLLKKQIICYNNFMQTDFINQIEPTPKLNTKKCQTIAFLLKIVLQYSIYIFTFIAWYSFDYFIAIGIFLLSYIIIGIIKSKLRNSVIPKTQQEYNYNDKGIADWYTARELCIEID